MKHYICIGMLFLLSACATQVTSIKLDKDKELLQGMGYILLGIETNRDLQSITISGPQKLKLSSKDIRKGTNYLLVDLKAGRYELSKIQVNSAWWVSLDDDQELWTVEVLPQTINYVGHLELVDRGYWTPITQVELVNRASEALEFMEKDFPNILAGKGLIYRGPGEDDFLEKQMNLSGVKP